MTHGGFVCLGGFWVAPWLGVEPGPRHWALAATPPGSPCTRLSEQQSGKAGCQPGVWPSPCPWAQHSVTELLQGPAGLGVEERGGSPGGGRVAPCGWPRLQAPIPPRGWSCVWEGLSLTRVRGLVSSCHSNRRTLTARLGPRRAFRQARFVTWAPGPRPLALPSEPHLLPPPGRPRFPLGPERPPSAVL